MISGKAGVQKQNVVRSVRGAQQVIRGYATGAKRATSRPFNSAGGLQLSNSPFQPPTALETTAPPLVPIPVL